VLLLAPCSHEYTKHTKDNNEVFFKIKRQTPLKRLMDAYCERQGKDPKSVRFMFDGERLQETDTPDKVGLNSNR